MKNRLLIKLTSTILIAGWMFGGCSLFGMKSVNAQKNNAGNALEYTKKNNAGNALEYTEKNNSGNTYKTTGENTLTILASEFNNGTAVNYDPDNPDYFDLSQVTGYDDFVLELDEDMHLCGVESTENLTISGNHSLYMDQTDDADIKVTGGDLTVEKDATIVCDTLGSEFMIQENNGVGGNVSYYGTLVGEKFYQMALDGDALFSGADVRISDATKGKDVPVNSSFLYGEGKYSIIDSEIEAGKCLDAFIWTTEGVEIKNSTVSVANCGGRFIDCPGTVDISESSINVENCGYTFICSSSEVTIADSDIKVSKCYEGFEVGELELDNSKIDIASTSFTIYGVYGLTVNGGSLSVETIKGDYAIIVSKGYDFTLGDNTYIKYPRDGEIGEYSMNITVVDGSGNVCKKVVISENQDVNDISVTADYDKIVLNPIYKQGDVSAEIKKSLGDKTKNTTLVTENSGLVYRDSTGSLHVVTDTDSNLVDTSKTYMLRVALNPDEGYAWPKCILDAKPNVLYDASSFSETMSFSVNDTKSDSMKVGINKSKNYLMLYVPVEISKVDINKLGDELSVSGIQDKIYTGIAITQNVKVSIGRYILKENVDYKLAYEGNIEVGEAYVFINGTGNFKGTVGKTFNIKDYNPDKGKGSDDPGDDKDKDVTPVYKNEWVDGKWYNADGTQTYAPTLQWKQSAYGWWVEDTSGWYPKSQWQKINGKWYYFCADGYMDYSEYRDSCWLGADGAWVEEYYGGMWMYDSYGWWYQDDSDWFPRSQWLWIDGCCYYFKASGYMATSQYIGASWVNEDGVWVP